MATAPTVDLADAEISVQTLQSRMLEVARAQGLPSDSRTRIIKAMVVCMHSALSRKTGESHGCLIPQAHAFVLEIGSNSA